MYSAPTAPQGVQLAALHGGELACASALRRYGVWILEDERRTHVWLGAKGRAHPHHSCACVVHRDAGRSAFGMVSVP
ncbi:MAG TPA: hypothetical protein VFY91_15555, partial [Microbacterium sp.]|nr:hypothetical protein [Microbacterium sp.]